MTDYQRQLTSAGTLADLPAVIDFVQESAAQAGVDPQAWFDLQLAVEEACANVIEHAYGKQGGEYQVTFATDGSDVKITIVDHGRPFDPKSAERAQRGKPLSKRRLGGLGLHLMEQLMDEVDFCFSDASGNVLTMVKRGVVRSGREPEGA